MKIVKKSLNLITSNESLKKAEQEKVKHIITCFIKALLHVFKCIYTYIYRFLHVFDNSILTKLYAFLLCQKIGRSFCLLSGREIDPRDMHILSWKKLPFPADSRKASFQLFKMEYAPSTGELPL